MKTSDRGLEFNHTYSPVTSDAAWIGFHKAANFADYIAVSTHTTSTIVIVPLLTLSLCTILRL